MTGIIGAARHAPLLTLLALAVAGCGAEPVAEAEAPAAGAPANEVEVEAEVDAASDAAAAGASAHVHAASDEPGSTAPSGEPGIAPSFDIALLPRSDGALGTLPYFTLPDGYRESGGRHTTQVDFGQVALWVGDRFHIAEGQVYATGIRADRSSGKQYSGLEVARNLEHAVTLAGGVEVFAGEIPRDVRDDAETVMHAWPTEAKCRINSPVQVFALRRDDGNVWVRTCTAQNFAGMIVVREQPLEVTSSLTPATEMAEQLASAGRVAVQVNFATDSADILPDSQPQLDQMRQLLDGDPALRLSINGHTDATGDAAYNQRLSEQRAQAVVDALAAGGVDPSRLEARGHGQSQPVADEDTEQGRARNRRVELIKL